MQWHRTSCGTRRPVRPTYHRVTTGPGRRAAAAPRPRNSKKDNGATALPDGASAGACSPRPFIADRAGSQSGGDVAALDPFNSCKLVINGSDRAAERPGAYFRYVQPYQYHPRCPQKKVHVFSFALDPEAPFPTGTMNFTRLQSVELQVQLNQYATSGKVVVFARNHNLLRISNGYVGLMFPA